MSSTCLVKRPVKRNIKKYIKFVEMIAEIIDSIKFVENLREIENLHEFRIDVHIQIMSLLPRQTLIEN